MSDVNVGRQHGRDGTDSASAAGEGGATPAGGETPVRGDRHPGGDDWQRGEGGRGSGSGGVRGRGYDRERKHKPLLARLIGLVVLALIVVPALGCVCLTLAMVVLRLGA